MPTLALGDRPVREARGDGDEAAQADSRHGSDVINRLRIGAGSDVNGTTVERMREHLSIAAPPTRTSLPLRPTGQFRATPGPIPPKTRNPGA